MVPPTLLVCGVATLLVDQWSKRAVYSSGATLDLQWGSLVRFHFVPHRKHAFERMGARVVLVFTWLLALSCSTVLHWSGHWFQGAMSVAGLGLALGGSASNLLDILQRRYVVDFIDLGWWPVFNLADVAIVVGLPVALLFG